MQDLGINIQNAHWENEESFILLNPRLSTSEKEQLQGLFRQFPLKSHFWLTSSGSSVSANESVKLIALSKKAILVAAKSVNLFLESTKSDHWLNPLPLFHIGGLSIYARAHLSGAKVTDFSNEKWNAGEFAKKVVEAEITLTSLVPTQVYDLVQAEFPSPKNLRAILVGGAALSPQLYQKARNLGWPLLPSFGMTETSAVIACAPLSSLIERHFPSLQVLSHIQVRLSEKQQLMISSDSLLTGYARMKKTEAVWTQPVHEGWLTTDDFAKIEVDRQQTFLRPLGREQDFIKIKGEGVNLALLRQKLEYILQKHNPKYLQKIVLIARPHERDQASLQFVCEASVEEKNIALILQEFNQTTLPYEKVLSFHFVEQIPRTSLGKVIWNQLV